ncbi:MAG: BamA/TamA family outer membrane protein [Spirosomaceae bacterium]|nr:BamA/TamA family outer membrane protein [Spirosomataceae bacterium]
MVKILFIFFNFFAVPDSLVTAQQDSTLKVVREVVIEGNVRTNASIINRELPFEIGDTLQNFSIPGVLARCQSNVFNTNLFITVAVTATEVFENEIVVTITVKERWYVLVLPVVFLSDRSFNEWWYERNRDLRRLTYGVQARHFNLTGKADQLALRVYGGFVPYFEASYSRPYIDKKQRMGVSTGVFYSTQRTVAFRTQEDKLQFLNTDEQVRRRWGGYFQYTFRNNLYHTHALYAGYNNTTVADTIIGLNPNYFSSEGRNQRYTQLSYTYRFDKRDNYQYALDGHLLAAGITKFGIGKNSDVNQLNLAATYTRFFPIIKKLYGDVSMTGKVSLPKLQPYTLTAGLGFRNALVRGYELYVIDGQDYGLLRSNLKYQFMNRTFDLSRFVKVKQFSTLPVAAYFTTYLDAGYVRNSFPEFSSTFLGNRRLIGGGIGLDIVTWYDTIGRLNYSVNQLGEKMFFFSVVRNL